MLNEMSKKALGSLQPSGRTAPSSRLASMETTSAIRAGGRSLRVEGDETRRCVDRLHDDSAHRCHKLGSGSDDLYCRLCLSQREPDCVESWFLVARMGWEVMADLLLASELPVGFAYPDEFLRVVELGLTNLEPWSIMEGAQLRNRYHGIRDRYPSRMILPFARREDNDDVACWDVTSGGVAIIHDFASPGMERREVFSSFNAWLRQAIEDLINYEI